VHEVRHGFDEAYERPCEACGAPVRRVFNPAPVLFKGSGFYVTDSRRSAASSKPEKPKEAAVEAKADAAPSKEPKSGSSASEPAA
jgi:predicted nucleic acid-binding Zn ribbon protein